jgi:hypothetical protein
MFCVEEGRKGIGTVDPSYKVMLFSNDLIRTVEALKEILAPRITCSESLFPSDKGFSRRIP